MITHSELIERGVKWLRNTKGYVTVVSEAACMAIFERPDAIAFAPCKHSTLLEAKASRSDFFADRKKTHRTKYGMGNMRYYITPARMVNPEELPEGWGLLWVYPTITRMVKKPEFRESIHIYRNESIYMAALLSRVHYAVAGGIDAVMRTYTDQLKHAETEALTCL